MNIVRTIKKSREREGEREKKSLEDGFGDKKREKSQPLNKKKSRQIYINAVSHSRRVIGRRLA